jgi:cytochrome c5
MGCLFVASAAPGQKLPDGKGEDIVEAACDGCHGQEEFKAVVDYLVANFGEGTAKPKQAYRISAPDAAR